MSEPMQIFHEGERAVQRLTGEEDAANQNASMIANTLMPGADAFLRAQRMLVIASRDVSGNMWTSLIFGKPGFMSAADGGQSVVINRLSAFIGDADILQANLKLEAPLGLLAIDLSTRRRLRINGRIVSLTSEQVVLRIEEAFAICPKYIQRRRLQIGTHRENPASIISEGKLPPAALLAAVKRADTVFVASGHASRGLDASHRGGLPGFIDVLEPDLFRIPDYVGNSLFNTLGNLSIDARCGLTLVNFGESYFYQMTGTVILSLNMPHMTGDPALTGRFWDFRVHAWRRVEIPVDIDWAFIDYSPYNPA